ncbi:MAG TPA: IS1634 family transposase [Nitrospirota bacterium]
MYLRTVKVRSFSGTLNEYVRVVEAYRQNGKVKQRTIADLGRKDLLVELLPKLQQLLGGDAAVQTGETPDPDILDAATWGPVLAVRALFDQLGLWSILDTHLGKAKGVPFADRAFVLVADRLIHPGSEHGLAGWLETDFVCDRRGRRFLPHWHKHNRVRVHFRQLEAWYRTLDQLVAAKDTIELALYHHLRDLFCLKPDLVLYDITSTYFAGAGPAGFAKHGYSRDGKPHNVQVIVGVVMVAGWPIAHHVWAGNRVDHATVHEVVRDLHQRFQCNRLVFVGDRGMVTEENLEALTAGKHGYLVGLKRRHNDKLDEWVAAVDEAKWVSCPVGITARERANPPRTRAQEVPSGVAGMQVIVVDSEERRAYEQEMRQKSMERTRLQLQKLEERVAAGKLKRPEKIGAAAERILQRHHGSRYYAWELRQGGFRYFENTEALEREKGIEGKYVIATSEATMSVLDAVAIYKELSDVEQGFRQLKDVLALRPIYHQIETRVKAHIFVAALALLVQRLLHRRLEEAGVDFSTERAMQALSTVRLVTLRLEDQPTRRGVSGGSPDARRVLKALKLTELKPPLPPAGEETVM